MKKNTIVTICFISNVWVFFIYCLPVVLLLVYFCCKDKKKKSNKPTFIFAIIAHFLHLRFFCHFFMLSIVSRLAFYPLNALKVQVYRDFCQEYGEKQKAFWRLPSCCGEEGLFRGWNHMLRDSVVNDTYCMEYMKLLSLILGLFRAGVFFVQAWGG